MLPTKNESPGDQKTAAREFSTPRFTPKKTRIYESKKNPTITQWKPRPHSARSHCYAFACNAKLYKTNYESISSSPGGLQVPCSKTLAWFLVNTSIIGVWPCFLVRASIGPIQWGVGWLPIHNQFVFYGVGTRSNMFLDRLSCESSVSTPSHNNLIVLLQQ